MASEKYTDWRRLVIKTILKALLKILLEVIIGIVVVHVSTKTIAKISDKMRLRHENEKSN